MSLEPAARERIVLAIDRKGWRIWAAVWFGCLVVVLVATAVGSVIAYGAKEGLVVGVVFTMLFLPLLWVAWFAFRAARSEAWIDVAPGQLILHHPVFLGSDLDLSGVIGAFYVGEASGYAQPSIAAPDLLSVQQARRWNLVIVLGESFFLAGTSRRALGVFRYLNRGMVCSRAPHRNHWIRGLFASLEDTVAGSAALERAGIKRLAELSPEVLAWLANDPPVSLRRAWANLRRDRGRKEPGPYR